jgi:predicted glycogen debranching enzyme
VVLTLQKEDASEVISMAVSDRPIEDLLTKEWLLTNSRGGYCSSTVIGCNTRRYHGLLIGSVNPPANRIMGLSNCLEMVIFNGKVFNLSTFEFSGKFAPRGFEYIERFSRDTGVHFHYRLNEPETPLSGNSTQAKSVTLTKSIYLLRDTDTVALVYDFTNLDRLLRQKDRKKETVEDSVEFVLRPFIGLRDFHALQRSYARLCAAEVGSNLLVRHDLPDGCELLLSCPSMYFVKDEQWWFNFVYRKDKERGQDFTEDLWSPGFFKCRLGSTANVVLWASLGASVGRKHDNTQKPDNCAATEQPSNNFDIDSACKQLRDHQEDLKRKARRASRDLKYEALCLAADQFIAGRQRNHQNRTTILAGYPWFADWGRDAFISLPGLLLSTGRFDKAKSVLTSFAHAADEGMIPNRFDDYSETAYFNSIDASLWFVYAAFQYLEASGDSQTFTQELLPTMRWVVDSFRKGTRFGIRADSDGLITGGNEETQLTWMDAKCDGIAFTARHGKAVEINALWHNNLCCLARFYEGRDMETARRFKSMSEKVAAGFRNRFWNEAIGYLNDCILADGSVDTSLRPNQIFAVSLPFSPLSDRQQKCVVEVVEKNLLTPYGLRTLNVEDSRYHGEYTGPQRQRDEAYHQGTVWPYLIGPFVEAYLKVNDFSRKSKRKAAEFIQPLLLHLTEDGCLGQVGEIFDGDAPHRPRGCTAQAWSVAELIRAYQLIHS